MPSPTPSSTSTATPSPGRSATVTSTPTSTPSATALPTPTPTPTSQRGFGHVAGQVVLERRGSNAGATVQLLSRVFVTGGDGKFVFNFVDAGPTFDRIEVRHPSYLRQTRPVQVLPNITQDVGLILLLAGDVNADGEIGRVDYERVAAALGLTSGDPDWSRELDITADGQVDIFDLVAVLYNVGQKAAP